MPLQRCIQALRTFLLWRSEGVGNADSQALVRQLVRVQALRAPPALLGRAGGGACCRLQCSTPLAARPWEHHGWSPKAPLGASLPWTTCGRSLSQLARAASRCAKRGISPSRWAMRLRHMTPHSRMLLRNKNCPDTQSWRQPLRRIFFLVYESCRRFSLE